VDDRLTVEIIEIDHDSLLEFGFRSHPDATQDRSRHLREEALDQVEPGTMLWREDEAEAALALCGKPRVGLFRHACRMIVQNDLDRGIGRVGRVELLEKADEFARRCCAKGSTARSSACGSHAVRSRRRSRNGACRLCDRVRARCP
jgi:hypothetical protein